MSPERNPMSDKELWRRLAPTLATGVATGPAMGEVASVPVSDLDFAAWLEGRLSEAQSARIEAAVAEDAEMRRAALEVADILGKPLPAAPERLQTRARALVGFDVERSPSRVGLLDWLFAKDRRFVVQRAAALTAAVVIAVSGFMMGGGLGESMAGERYAANWPQSSYGSSSSELTEFLVSDGI